MMALTIEQIEQCKAILEDTKGFRDVMHVERRVPESYSNYRNQVKFSQVTVNSDGEFPDVTCFISEAMNKIDGCPVHINMHGGGFYYGHSEDDNLYCAHVASEITGIVVDVDYSLTPEYPFPTAFDQCYEVAGWVFENLESWGADKAKVSIGGHSAGANLAAAIALKAALTKDYGFCLQVLDFAPLDFYSKQSEKKSFEEVDENMCRRMDTFTALYTDGDESLTYSPYVSPLNADDEMLDSLPPAVIVTGGKDSLRFEAEEYGMRMVGRGVKVTMRRFMESRHGFTIRMRDEWEASQKFIINEILNAKREL